MSKGKGITFTLFAALGALAGYASYMAQKNEFSSETKEKVDTFLNKMQNVGTDIKRTYTSIGDKKAFKNRSKDLGNSSLNLARKTGDLIASASTDMYKYAKKQISTAMENYKDDDKSGNYDDLDTNYIAKKHKSSKKKKSNKTTNKKTKKKSK